MLGWSKKIRWVFFIFASREKIEYLHFLLFLDLDQLRINLEVIKKEVPTKIWPELYPLSLSLFVYISQSPLILVDMQYTFLYLFIKTILKRWKPLHNPWEKKAFSQMHFFMPILLLAWQYDKNNIFVYICIHNIHFVKDMYYVV